MANTTPTTRRVRMETHDDALRLVVDTEDHDLGLLRSVADAVRTNPEVVHLLDRWAEVQNGIDEAHLSGRRPTETAALEDESADLLGEISRDFDWSEPGDAVLVQFTRAEVLDLYHALGNFLMNTRTEAELAEVIPGEVVA